MIYLFDCDGTLISGNRVIPGAIECVRDLCARGNTVMAITNSSSSTSEQKRQFLNSIGFNFTDGHVHTALTATILYCMSLGLTRVFVVGCDTLKSELQKANIVVVDTGDPLDQEVQAVVIGISASVNVADLVMAQHYVEHVCTTVIACNPDQYYPTEEGFCPGAGSIVSLVLSPFPNVKPFVTGKPSRSFIPELSATAGMVNIVMVGDNPKTDMLFGSAIGAIRVLVETGVYSVINNELSYADYIIPSVSKLSDRALQDSLNQFRC
jgi:HAD superfamily hydrolase (TIGR01450 family)